MLKFRDVKPRREIEKWLLYHENTCFVSITDPWSKDANFWKNIPEEDILRLKFSDVDKYMLTKDWVKEAYNPMTSDQGKLIVDFIYAMEVIWKESIVFHCEAGISRSAWVCMWFLAWYFSDTVAIKRFTWKNRYIPNTHVCEIVRKEFQRREYEDWKQN